MIYIGNSVTLDAALMCIQKSYDKKQVKQGVRYCTSFECIYFKKKTTFTKLQRFFQ